MEQKTDSIVESVITKYLNRSKVGIEKYGTTIEENNKDNFLNHLQEELFDASLYVEKLMSQQKKNSLENKIVQWADERNILKPENIFQQFAKFQEESGELASALLKKDVIETKDALGDCVITLHILAAQLGYSLDECTNLAYEEIKNRKGKTENGTFIKEK